MPATCARDRGHPVPSRDSQGRQRATAIASRPADAQSWLRVDHLPKASWHPNTPRAVAAHLQHRTRSDTRRQPVRGHAVGSGRQDWRASIPCMPHQLGGGCVVYATRCACGGRGCQSAGCRCQARGRIVAQIRTNDKVCCQVAACPLEHIRLAEGPTGRRREPEMRRRCDRMNRRHGRASLRPCVPPATLPSHATPRHAWLALPTTAAPRHPAWQTNLPSTRPAIEKEDHRRLRSRPSLHRSLAAQRGRARGPAAAKKPRIHARLNAGHGGGGEVQVTRCGRYMLAGMASTVFACR